MTHYTGGVSAAHVVKGYDDESSAFCQCLAQALTPVNASSASLLCLSSTVRAPKPQTSQQCVWYQRPYKLGTHLLSLLDPHTQLMGFTLSDITTHTQSHSWHLLQMFIDLICPPPCRLKCSVSSDVRRITVKADVHSCPPQGKLQLLCWDVTIPIRHSLFPQEKKKHDSYSGNIKFLLICLPKSDSFQPTNRPYSCWIMLCFIWNCLYDILEFQKETVQLIM